MTGAVRVRIAPSPTGPLHIGTARTALFNYLFARHTGGTFVLRLEDTDGARSTRVRAGHPRRPALAGPALGRGSRGRRRGRDAGPYGPYRQMERLPLLRGGRRAPPGRGQGLLLLLHARGARCRPQAARRRPSCRPATRPLRPPDGRRAGRASRPRAGRPRIRFRVGTGRRRLRRPRPRPRRDRRLDPRRRLRHRPRRRHAALPLPVVVDDAAMKISHVIRGEDHLLNTPKHILLFRALGQPVPRFAHLPLILNPDRTKMSKRKSQTARRRLHRRGLHPRGARQLPRAARLVDRAPRRRSCALDEIVERFNLEHVHKGGAVFDRERLEWLNGQWIRRLEPDELVDRLRPFVAGGAGGRPDRPDAGGRRARGRSLPLVQERLPMLGAIGDLVDFLCVRRARARPGPARARSAGTRRRRSTALQRGPRGHRRRPAPSRSRPTSSSRRSARWPRHAAGRPATCSWRSASRSPAGPRRRRCSTRSSRSAASGRSSRLDARHRALAGRRQEGGPMTHDDVQAWLDRYIAAWQTYDPDAIGDLFSEDAEYRYHAVGRARSSGARRSSPTGCPGRPRTDEPGSWSGPLRVVGRRRRSGRGDRRRATTTQPGRLVRTLYYNLCAARASTATAGASSSSSTSWSCPSGATGQLTAAGRRARQWPVNTRSVS